MDLNSGRIAAALERIADALERADGEAKPPLSAEEYRSYREYVASCVNPVKDSAWWFANEQAKKAKF